MSKIYGEEAKRESVDRLADAAMKSTEPNPAEIDEKFRRLLKVDNDATLEDILYMIVEAGWEPQLFRQEFDGELVWACPIRKGPFRTIQRDEETGEMAHVSFLTPVIAALDGLRRAREIDRSTF